MERAAYEYFARIDELGGMVEAIKRGFPQREIADASFRYQQEVDSGKRIVVGVNEYRLADEEELEIHRPDPGDRAKAGGQAVGDPRQARLGRGRAGARGAQAGGGHARART